MFYVCVLVAFVLFAGEPDLRDALMAKLREPACEVSK